MKNLYKILTGVFFSTTLLLGGCAYYSQEDTPTHDYKEDKKENKKDETSSLEEQENKQIKEDNTVQNNQQDNQTQGQDKTQAQQNEQMQEASRSEHNGLSNAEYADKYNQYREAQRAQAELENRTEADKASGGGGGGASWNYAGANESFEQWLQRSQQERAEAGLQ
ncbi:hypothetical protein [Staphylococcus phage vB_SauM-V1SA19]|nr:hypothetical protein [Staphylococcus phage vB_SauM-V1SA19]